MPRREHEVTFEVGGRAVRTPLSYSIDVDLLQPADAFTLAFPLDAHTWRCIPLDAEVQVAIDGVPVLNGFVDSLRDNGDGTFVAEGRDRSGRLVDESVPGAGFAVANKRLSEVVEDLVAPWYTGVTFSNAADRRLRRGRGKKSPAGKEPALTRQERLATAQRIEAGTTRWEALERFLRPLQLLAWSTADGRELVLARPQYDQAPQYELFETLAASNVKRMSLSKSVAGRYALLEVSGSGRPPGVPAPPFIPTFPGQKRPKYVARNRIGVARDGPADDGTGEDFIHPKRLFVVSEALSTAEAQLEAERALARGRVQARQLEVTVPGHGQWLDGASAPTLYAPDTVAIVRKEVEAAPGDDAPAVLVDASFYCTRVTYQGSRDDEQTTLGLVPLGTFLT
ncbi:phage baseplate assembly protein [Haliangium sp.]|uniref:phage baseplate assembly protein n=1 Tax=Haliangium sp. TaxID=2663208 RepID=UPI003D0F2040